MNAEGSPVNAPAAGVNAGVRRRLGRVPVEAEAPRACDAPPPKKHCDRHNDVACYRAETVDLATGVVRRKFFCLGAAGAWAYRYGLAFPPGMWDRVDAPEAPPCAP